MPEEFTDDTDDGEDSPTIQQMRERIKTQNAELRAARESADKAQELERRLAFAEAQIGDSPMKQYFVRGYEGDMTSDAIRAAATAAGLPLLGQASSPPPPDRTADLAAHAQMNQAGQGGTSDADQNAAYHAELAATDGSWEQVKQVLDKYQVPTSDDYR